MSKNKSSIKGNNNNTFQNIKNSTFNINSGSNEKLPILLTNLPEKSSVFIGRENKIKEVEEALANNKKAVIVNGFGGIGKTSIASHFFLEKTAHYSHKAWLRFTDNLIESYFTTPLPTHFDIVRRAEIPIEVTINQLLVYYNLYRRHGSLRKELNVKTPIQAIYKWFEIEPTIFKQTPKQFETKLINLQQKYNQNS